MGKRKRQSSRAPQAAAVMENPATADGAWMSGFSGASFSYDRSQIWWPSLDTRQELDSFSRDELMRRIRALCANVGFPKGIVKNSANLVGWQSPRANSGDPEWDAMADASYDSRCLTPEVFDHSGKYDFEDAQIMLKRAKYKDGDALTVLSEWENGAARFAFYEAHQLRNPERPPAGQRWKDGVQLGPGNRHLAYGLWDPESDQVVVVPARNVIYSGHFESPGHVRAVPPLAHAVNHTQDITEVWKNYKDAIKASSLFGAIRELDGNAVPIGRQGIAGTASTVATNTTGENVEASKVFGGGQIPRLANGEKMKILTDDRPHPNVRQFVADLIRDIAIGFGLPPEVVWEMVNLTGPGVRFVMDVADRWIKHEQKADRRWGKRVWAYFIAKEIKAGRLPMPRAAGARWWSVSFTSQRSITIDRGKESKSRLDEIDGGVGTWASWEEIDGMGWKERTRQRIREVSFAKTECAAEGLDYREVFPVRQGAAAPQTSANDTPPPEEATP